MGKKNFKPNNQRETNVSTKVRADKPKAKVNGGVFVYTGAISTSELAEKLNNITNWDINGFSKFTSAYRTCVDKDTTVNF